MDSHENNEIEILTKIDGKPQKETTSKGENKKGGSTSSGQKRSLADTEIIDLDDSGNLSDDNKNEESKSAENLNNETTKLSHYATDSALKNRKSLKVDEFSKPNGNENETSLKLMENKEKEEKINNAVSLVDNQVQCVNLHCQSGFDLAEAPVFVLSHFGKVRQKNVLQKVCRACFNVALAHQEKMCEFLCKKLPLLTLEFPSQKDDVVVMDSVDEIYEEEILSPSVISVVEEELVDVMKSAFDKYDVDFQIKKSEQILTKKYKDLTDNSKTITDELNKIENQLREMKELIYKDFNPRIKHLPALDINEYGNVSTIPAKPRAVALKKTSARNFVAPSPSLSSPRPFPPPRSSLRCTRPSLPSPRVPSLPSVRSPSLSSPRSPYSPVARSPSSSSLRASSSPSRNSSLPPPRSPSVPSRPSASSASSSPVESSRNAESNDIVALTEVEIQVKLPPMGNLVRPVIHVGHPVYVMKLSFFSIWVKAKVVEIVSQTPDSALSYRVRFDAAMHGKNKVVTGKQIAYSKPSGVRYAVGTRVIALFQNTDSPGKSAYYVGIIAEPPKIINIFRYLVFFDDGYAQYVSHEKILLVCESSKHVYEDVHPDCRDFIKNYLDQYPERPMVKLQKGQVLKTEWNGKWWNARVLAIDGSLAKMQFDVDGRTEWIYRGSTRLGPLYSEMIAAAARKEQGALSRHRSLGIASLKKRNMPYVEYSVDQDDSKTPQSGVVSKNVAKKSTASRSSSQDSLEKNLGPPKANDVMEFTSKGYIRTISLKGRIEGKIFAPHQCGPACISWTKYSREDSKGINPLAVPFFYGFQRQIVKSKSKKAIAYRSPCGRRIRDIKEMHQYLRLTKSQMKLDLFDFNYSVRALDEFHLDADMYCTHIKDISHGQESVPVSCVNEISHNWPSFMNYSTSRLPQEGVNICLDEEFLVCCDCTDDCQDKEKCECWQLTIEGTKLGPGGVADYSVGYQYKRLPDPVPTGIYECNQRCKCAATCMNRVAQYPLQLNLQVFRTLRKGWGIRALNDIPKGGFICIYAGRLHTEQSANDDGRMYGDEYLAELDYIEVVERIKEGYESEVVEPECDQDVKEGEEEEDEMDENGEQDDIDEKFLHEDDTDYVPQGLAKLPKIESGISTRGRNKKINSEEKMDREKEGGENVKETECEEEKDKENEKEKEDKEKKEEIEKAKEKGKEKEKDKEKEKEKEKEEDAIITIECVDTEEDDDMKKKPSKFTAAVPVEEKSRGKSVREMFGDGADDCYVMDAKSIGNLGRYLNHSCQPNVFVQNVFVDTHDVRFPWVSFFALSHIKAGTELTWDYNYDVGSVPGKVLYCYCNSAECRGRLL